MITTEQADKLWSLIKGIKVGMLVSLAGDKPHARPMHLVQNNFTGTLWFFTAKESGKAREAVAEDKVCITFADHGTESYVSLTGGAQFTSDRAKIDALWNPFVGSYFPGGKDDPNLALLEIHIDGAEYWDANSSRMVQLFEFVKANITKEPPHLGEHRRVGSG